MPDHRLDPEEMNRLREATSNKEQSSVGPGERPRLQQEKTALERERKLATKDTNPKDAVGTAKAPMSCVPLPVVMELATAMMEGARKYGRHNYRVAGVRASVYFDALMRHMFAWFEGEDIDADSGLSHITKGIATLAVLRDAMMNDKWVDDRPPQPPEGWLVELNMRAAALLEKYPDGKAAYLEGDQDEV